MVCIVINNIVVVDSNVMCLFFVCWKFLFVLLFYVIFFFYILLMVVLCFFFWVGFKKVDRNVYIYNVWKYVDVLNDYGGGKYGNWRLVRVIMWEKWKYCVK